MCYYHDALTLSKIAGVLGKSNDAEKYAKLSQETKEAFNREFLEEDYYTYNSKVVDSLLHFDFCPEYDKKGYRKECCIRKLPTFCRLYGDGAGK